MLAAHMLEKKHFFLAYLTLAATEKFIAWTIIPTSAVVAVKGAMALA